MRSTLSAADSAGHQSEQPASAPAAPRPMASSSASDLEEQALAKVSAQLQLYVAILSAIGGLVLGSSPETRALPWIAICFACIGYFLVDRLKLFALPASFAYAAMGVAAMRCILVFAELEEEGNQQIVAVAELLVVVQAILMLQKKSRRIFEQLGVFCLLQLIVAAVFNDALIYGLLLIPAAVVGAFALSSLAAFTALERDPAISGGTSLGSPREITIESPAASHRVAKLSRRLPAMTLLGTAPAVLLLAATFFYALPRTTDASRSNRIGKAVVGFNDEVRFARFGQLHQNDTVALRVKLTDRRRKRPYRALGPLYLRGKVLERYASGNAGRGRGADWTSIPPHAVRGRAPLPHEYLSTGATDRNFYDAVDVQVSCEPMRSPALFTLVPHHATSTRSDVVHELDRWTLRRRRNNSILFGASYPRIRYSFGTHCFRNGLQSEWTTRYASTEHKLRSIRSTGATTARPDDWDGPPRYDVYHEVLLRFDPKAMPTVERLARQEIDSIPEAKRTTVRIARRLERFLSLTGGFRYTLNLDSEPVAGTDPIEQFVKVDKKGHCQYFASALVMMLRSLDIPARMVVGYRTDEYNPLGQVYVARQYHAHAWVEVLVERRELAPEKVIYGQPAADEYWLRLDPTPGAVGDVQPAAGGVRQALDLAQTIWDDYIVEMDRQQQETGLASSTATAGPESLDNLVRRAKSLFFRFRSGQWGGGSLARRNLFSWPAALAAIALTLLVLVLINVRPLRRWLPLARGKSEGAAQQSSIAFYAEALQQLARLGQHRKPGETPEEFVGSASQMIQSTHRVSLLAPLEYLTSKFYQLRFGFGSEASPSSDTAPEVAGALADLRGRIDKILRTPGSRRSAGSIRSNCRPKLNRPSEESAPPPIVGGGESHRRN